MIAHTASKSAIEGMKRAIALELSSKGIRVNCIAQYYFRSLVQATARTIDNIRKYHHPFRIKNQQLRYCKAMKRIYYENFYNNTPLTIVVAK